MPVMGAAAMKADADVVTEAGGVVRRLADAANLALLQRPGPTGGPFWDPRAAMQLAASAPAFDALVIRLLLAGSTERRDDLERVFGPQDVATLEAAGLLVASDDGLASRLLLASFLNRHVLAAPPHGHPRFHRDLAPYCGPESLWYGRMLAGRGPFRRHLDLCTGSTLMALLPQAAETVAVDLDPTVVPVARLNLAINGRGDIALRFGDLYAPVAGEGFDFITANPPFLPQGPDDALPLCGAGGRDGGIVAERILAGVPAHLRERGEALIYCEGFGGPAAPALAERVAAARSPDFDTVCWIGSTANADRAIFGLVALWQAAGVSEEQAWQHWADIAATMPASHYHTMVWQLRPGRGTFSVRQLGPG